MLHEKEEILKRVKQENVRFVQFAFMDILGIPKMVSVPSTKLEHALAEGVVFDGSSIVGYATIEESDMRMHPVLDTFNILPWESYERKTARFICNIHDSSGKRFEGDPRLVLERLVKKAAEQDMRFYTGPEYEFFLFKMGDDGAPTMMPNDGGGYFDLMPLDSGELVRKDVVNYLINVGIDAEASHHEVAPGQHEIDLHYSDAMNSADRVFMLKDAIKTAARHHDLHATFMPKPAYGRAGNGMHVHQSLFNEKGENIFHKPDGKFELSKTAYQYLAGLLKYSKEMCAVLASWVNSYKRLVPGYEAPVYISWANRNRSALIRVPAGRGTSTRLEMRNPDSAGNPYLQFAVMLGAGLKGIEDKLEAPEPVERDIYHIPEKEREKLGIEGLPQSLGHALACLEESKVMQDILGKHIFQHFLHVKNKEWDDYRAQVTPWEIERMINL
jgi:glutamine synthetase